VVHGAMIVRPNRGIAASRDRATTGRRPMSASTRRSPRYRVRGRGEAWVQRGKSCRSID
jgi:hypothetical protein